MKKKSFSLAAMALMLMLFSAVSVFAAGTDTNAADSGTMVAEWEFLDDVWDESGQVVTEKTKTQDIVAEIPDPLEGWNRMWFQFNDKMYFYFAKPLAQGYSYVIPERPRMWVRNFFRNLLFPVRFVGCLLQGKFLSAGMETSKFIANTSVGLLGFADVTSELEPVRPTPTGQEDVGQAFGAWGIGNGMYMVWPFLGPSTARDTVGSIGDHFLTPTTYLNPWWASMSVKAYEKINDVSLRIGEYETLIEGSVDPYEAMKDAYIRYRARMVSE